MKFDDFTKRIAENPNKDAQVTRFLYKDRTLWFKRDHRFYPMLTHWRDFIVVWATGVTPHSSRTHNMHGQLLQGTQRRWLEGISAGGKKPAVWFKLPANYMSVSSVLNGATTKMLLLGIYPEDPDYTREYWSHSCTDFKGRSLEIGACFDVINWDPSYVQSTLEEVLTEFAYRTIQKENLWKLEGRALTQHIHNLERAMNAVIEQEQKAAARDYTPPEGEAGISHLADLIVALGGVVRAQSALTEDLDKLYHLLCRPTAAQIVESTRGWGDPVKGQSDYIRYADSNPHLNGIDFDTHDTVEKLTEALARIPDLGNGSLLIQFGDYMFGDHSPRSGSYYWFKQNFKHYQACFRKLNLLVRPLFGQEPDEWDYQELAAPRFLEEG